MRKALALGTAAASLTALGLAAAPAQAADALVTLPVGLAADTLSITAPVAVVVPGSPATATIATTVADVRLTGTGWTSTISSTNLTLTGVTPGATETIPASSMTAYTGNVTPVLPTITVDGEYTSGAPLTLSNSAQTLLAGTARSNANTTIFTTTVVIPTAGKTAGVYTGTVTQSVS